MPDGYAWTFSTSADGQGTDQLHILAFTGEDSLCQGYRFDILLLAAKVTNDNAPAFLQAMAGAGTHTLSCTATLGAATCPFVWHGIPERVEWLFSITGGGGQVLRVLLRPTSYKLRLSVHSRIFLGAGVPTLLQNLLAKEGFTLSGTNGDAATTRLQQNYNARPLSCQYNESSYDFLQRHLERVGGYSYIAQDDNNGRDVLVLDDGAATPESLPVKSTLDWDVTGVNLGTVSGFIRTMNPGPSSITLRDYSTDKPGSELLSATPAPVGPGVVSTPMSFGAANYFGLFNMFGEMSLTAGYSDTDAQTQGRLMAQARMRAQVSRSNRSRGASTAAWMRPGYSVSLSGKSYLLLSVSSICNNCDTADEKSYVSRANDLGFTFDTDWADYSNTFTCHPLEVGPHAPEISTPRPVINGLTHAEVYAPNSTGGYALLDSQGRYNVKFPFAEAVYDSTNTAVIGEDGNPGAVPVPLRMAQINAGTKGTVHSGVSFPLTNGTEVLVVFTDGDPDRPVIVSALPNATNTGVVTADNNKTNVIKTPGGHTLTMDDTAAAPKITLTSNAGHTLTMDDTADSTKITLTSKAGHTLTLDDTVQASKITLTSRGGHMIAVNDDDTAHAVKIASSDGKMSLLMDQKDGALTIRYGDNSTKLTGAKAYELISTHKESSIWGNVYATVMGAEEKFNILEKLTTTVGASQTLNLGLNSVFNMGVNNVMNMGNNSATNLGNTQTIIGGSEAKLTVGASGDAGISKMMTFVQTVLI